MVSFKRGSEEMKEVQLIGCILTSAKRQRKKEPLFMKKNGHHQDQTLHWTVTFHLATFKNRSRLIPWKIKFVIKVIPYTDDYLPTEIASCIEVFYIFKVEYDPTSIDVTHGVQFRVVYITYTINGRSQRYAPSSPLRLTDLPTMAESVSMEVYENYV